MGVKASGWELDRFFSCLYWLFKDTPARREDFMKITETTTFPLKFCKHRWLENTPVCERAILLMPQIVSYVKAVSSGKCADPKTKSFETIKNSTSDVLSQAKMAFSSLCPSRLHPS